MPVKLDGLLGAQGNVGFSSIVSSAIRLHDQRVHLGRAVGATAAVCLLHKLQPREIPYDRTRMEQVRHALCGGTEGAPLLLWPYRDLPANHPAFVAINRLAARGLIPLTRREVDFQPDAPAAEDWCKAVVELAAGYQFVAPAAPVAAKLTRGEFAQFVWKHAKAQAPPAWPRRSADDADADGIPDLEDALPFTQAQQSWLEKDSAGPASSANTPLN